MKQSIFFLAVILVILNAFVYPLMYDKSLTVEAQKEWTISSTSYSKIIPLEKHLLYYQSNEAKLLEKATGKSILSKTTDAWNNAQLFYSDGQLYTINNGQTLFQLNPLTLAVIWQTPLDDIYNEITLESHQGLVLVHSINSYSSSKEQLAFVLDATTGKIIHQAPVFPNTESPTHMEDLLSVFNNLFVFDNWGAQYFFPKHQLLFDKEFSEFNTVPKNTRVLKVDSIEVHFVNEYQPYTYQVFSSASVSGDIYQTNYKETINYLDIHPSSTAECIIYTIGERTDVKSFDFLKPKSQHKFYSLSNFPSEPAPVFSNQYFVGSKYNNQRSLHQLTFLNLDTWHRKKLSLPKGYKSIALYCDSEYLYCNTLCYGNAYLFAIPLDFESR